MLGDVAAAVEGLEAALLLMLFVQAGHAVMLEGAACGDGTIGLDLEALRFAIGSD